MKKLSFLICAVFIFICIFSIKTKAVGLNDVSAECAVLMSVQTGEILFAKNAHERHSMASTTKIMTSLLAVEQYTPGRTIRVKNSMLKVEGTSMGLLDGDTVTLEGLIYGMLLQSGNDAANVTAITLGGSVEKFAEMMNSRAKEIGMKSTNFVTASGLDDENHYSTAYDMALLGCEAVKNPEFLNVCSDQKAVVSYGNPPYDRTLTNHNRLLYSFEGTVGDVVGRVEYLLDGQLIATATLAADEDVSIKAVPENQSQEPIELQKTGFFKKLIQSIKEKIK